MSDLAAIDRYLETHLDDSIAELKRYAAQPSIAAQGRGMGECARLVEAMLARRGFRCEIMPTAGAEVVVAERAGAGERTLLIYNHYDV